MSYDESWRSYQDWRADDSGEEPFQAFVLYRADLDLKTSQRTRPYSLLLSLSFLSPEPDGLYTEEEFEVLERLDAALVDSFDAAEVFYVGRVTGGAKRFYCCYAEDGSRTARLREEINSLEARFPGYRTSIDEGDDAEWAIYKGSFVPEPDDG